MKKVVLIVAALVVLTPAAACAQSQAQHDALDYMVAEVSKFCPSVPMAYTESAKELKGKIGATLPGLLTHVIDIDAEVEGHVRYVQSKGMLPGDLAGAVHDSMDCQESVRNMLAGILFPRAAGESEIDKLEHVVSFICGRGVLHVDRNWEIPSEVRASVQALRDRIEITVEELPASSAGLHSLMAMQEASSDLFHNPVLFPTGLEDQSHPVNADSPVGNAVGDYRRIMSKNLHKLAVAYPALHACSIAIEVKSKSSGEAGGG